MFKNETTSLNINRKKISHKKSSSVLTLSELHHRRGRMQSIRRKVVINHKLAIWMSRFKEYRRELRNLNKKSANSGLMKLTINQSTDNIKIK